ncbi:hypothetical protein HDU93_001748 [Gonapodya sp. JEL0774]|nr:hypothetical protein HDU93_001748 [Gonapodya sp. JEL0774]
MLPTFPKLEFLLRRIHPTPPPKFPGQPASHNRDDAWVRRFERSSESLESHSSVLSFITDPEILQPLAILIAAQTALFLTVRWLWIRSRRRQISKKKREMGALRKRDGLGDNSLNGFEDLDPDFELDPLQDPTFERKVSWILTFFSSLVMTLAGTVAVAGWVTHGWDIERWPLYGTSRLSLWISIYFMSYMWCDIAIGSVFYPYEITLLSGYIHHVLFTLIVLFALYTGLPAAFLPFGLLELPTFVMAIGQLNKKYRADLTFGLSYFVTRVLLHVALGWSVATELDVGVPYRM